MLSHVARDTSSPTWPGKVQVRPGFVRPEYESDFLSESSTCGALERGLNSGSSRSRTFRELGASFCKCQGKSAREAERMCELWYMFLGLASLRLESVPGFLKFDWD